MAEVRNHPACRGLGGFVGIGSKRGYVAGGDCPTSALRHLPSPIHWPIILIKSTHLFAYPHSLSYQPLTFTIVLSTTLVLNASRMQL